MLEGVVDPIPVRITYLVGYHATIGIRLAWM